MLKGTLQRFPLEFNFLNQLDLKLFSCHLDGVIFSTLLGGLELHQVSLIGWILDGVVAEVKPFGLMNYTAHPLAEIGVIQGPLSLAIQVL